MEYRTIIQCEVPRIRYSVYGVLKVRVPWAEPLSRYTVAFDSYVIDWLQDASVSNIATNSWHGLECS